MSNTPEESSPPLIAWATVLLIVVVVGIVAVLDYFDGDLSSPSLYVLSTLATIAGFVLGKALPFGGRGGKR